MSQVVPQFMGDEVDRLAFQPPLPLLVGGKNGFGVAPNEPWFRKTTSGSSKK
jgi:hypothetical protein